MKRLIVAAPGKPERCIDLPEGRTTVGRTPDNVLQIEDPSVSRHHCELVVDGDCRRCVELAGYSPGSGRVMVGGEIRGWRERRSCGYRTGVTCVHGSVTHYAQGIIQAQRAEGTRIHAEE